MKEGLETDYKLETISDANNGPSNVYVSRTMPLDVSTHTSNKYARVKRHHVNGDLGSRSSLQGSTFS